MTSTKSQQQSIYNIGFPNDTKDKTKLVQSRGKEKEKCDHGNNCLPRSGVKTMHLKIADLFSFFSKP